MAGCLCEGSAGSQVARLSPDAQTVGSASAPGIRCVHGVCFIIICVCACLTLCVVGRGSERRSCVGFGGAAGGAASLQTRMSSGAADRPVCSRSLCVPVRL